VIDAELTALALDPILGGAGLAVDLSGITRVGVDEHQLADVVQQRGDHQAVTGLEADLAGDPIGGALGGDGVQAEALGDPLPHRRALEEVKRPRARGDRQDGLGRQRVDAGDDVVDAALMGAVELVGQTQNGDRQRHVGLHRRDDVADRRLAVLEQAQHAVARLDEDRIGLQRLERRRQPPPVALVVMALAGGVGIGRHGSHGGQLVLAHGRPPRSKARSAAMP
jgi:hypothetical protein